MACEIRFFSSGTPLGFFASPKIIDREKLKRMMPPAIWKDRIETFIAFSSVCPAKAKKDKTAKGEQSGSGWRAGAVRLAVLAGEGEEERQVADGSRRA